MLTFPNAKINLGLYITEKRADGYHNLETVFYPLPKLRDALEFVPAKNDRGAFHATGLPIAEGDAPNLVSQACKLLRARFPGKIPEQDIHLHKAIPMGAGLGGGSADAAFALKAMNAAYSLGLSQNELAVMALELGSDCPFFIYNTPQFAQGRGEIFTPLSLDLSAYSIQVVCPAVHVSTREAFAGIVPQAASFDLRKLAEWPVERWRGQVRNDFETSVFVQHPQLAEIKESLYQSGAVYASMSGSGSAVYGVFEKGRRAVMDGSFYFE